MKTIEELEVWMRNHIEAYVARGGRMQGNCFGNNTAPCACAIGACVSPRNPLREFIEITGLEAHDAWKIADGFDSIIPRISDPYWQLGQRLAKDYLT